MKWVRYGLRETSSKGRRECMDSCRIDVSEELGRYVATERNARSFATSVVRGLLALLKVERDKIRSAPYDGCLRSLVEGIKPFVVRLGVKKEDYELSSHARILAKRQILGSRIKVLDTMPRDVRDQCTGFRARPRFTPGFRGCDD
ncbi:hypothetical protein DY000_02054065 [Brassica cretica]|uniref:Uncharacterized protein n=1 Tax=Brassica cretica TaxID=69181 RepID=A0ABQ7AHR7_BRACR|nr:hypothetical protein DY000_02054065 [Brassica cretica]